MDSTERAYHDSFKPSWAPDGACIYSTSKPLQGHLIGGLAERPDPTLARVNLFTQRDFSSEVRACASSNPFLQMTDFVLLFSL